MGDGFFSAENPNFPGKAEKPGNFKIRINEKKIFSYSLNNSKTFFPLPFFSQMHIYEGKKIEKKEKNKCLL